MKDLLHGDVVRLVAENPETMARAIARWESDSEYWRLMTSEAASLHSFKSVKDWLEKELEKDPPRMYWFMIRTLEDDRLIGEIALDGVSWFRGDSFVGITIGDRADWGKGYGTDAMRVILRYAFRELNLRRVTLDVFEYNPRAIRSYEKVGFVHEGRARQVLHREGQLYDLIFMGILREEWAARYADW